MALAPLAGAKAGELKALVGGSMTDSMKELGPRFERATAHKLSFQFAGRRTSSSRRPPARRSISASCRLT
jgi:ABC-type molybdate transport system substrate-binding protein